MNISCLGLSKSCQLHSQWWGEGVCWLTVDTRLSSSSLQNFTNSKLQGFTYEMFGIWISEVMSMSNWSWRTICSPNKAIDPIRDITKNPWFSIWAEVLIISANRPGCLHQPNALDVKTKLFLKKRTWEKIATHQPKVFCFLEVFCTEQHRVREVKTGL